MAMVFVCRRQQHRSLMVTALLSEHECHGLLSLYGTLDVLALNVCKDYIQRASNEFACCLDAPDCGIKTFGDTTLWRGCLPARELAADSTARITASC